MSPRPALPLRLEYVILGLVRRQPVHGYELLQQWNDANQIGIVWHVKPGPLYSALEKLEQRGYIQAIIIHGDSSPQRKEYHVTTLGKQAFLDWMKTPVSAARDFRQDFLSRLFFAQDVDQALVEELISRQEHICQQWLKSLEKQLSSITGFEQQVLSFRMRQVVGILEWLQELPDKKIQISKGRQA